MSVNNQLHESSIYRSEQSRRLAERTQTLINISKKAREESLTLQETNDLYAEFNKTYDLSSDTTLIAKKTVDTAIADATIDEVIVVQARAESLVKAPKPSSVPKAVEPLKTVGLDGVDESWAIKLLNESELDDSRSLKGNYQASYREPTKPVLCEA